MRQIILIRHAKSSWEHDVIDHERPLKQRGVNDAKIIAKELKNHNLKIDKVIVSDAQRTQQTAEIMIPVIKVHQSIVSFSHKLYDFAGYNLTEVVKSCNNDINTLMVFGHNHAITSFVNTFGSQYIDNVPTCGVVVINFQVESWDKIKKGETVLTMFPRDLK